LPPSMGIALWLLANVLFVGLWDVCALFFLSEEDTVSHWLQAWFRQLPVLALVVGIVLGHLAWPLHSIALKEVKQE